MNDELPNGIFEKVESEIIKLGLKAFPMSFQKKECADARWVARCAVGTLYQYLLEKAPEFEEAEAEEQAEKRFKDSLGKWQGFVIGARWQHRRYAAQIAALQTELEIKNSLPPQFTYKWRGVDLVVSQSNVKRLLDEAQDIEQENYRLKEEVEKHMQVDYGSQKWRECEAECKRLRAEVEQLRK